MLDNFPRNRAELASIQEMGAVVRPDILFCLMQHGDEDGEFIDTSSSKSSAQRRRPKSLTYANTVACVSNKTYLMNSENETSILTRKCIS